MKSKQNKTATSVIPVVDVKFKNRISLMEFGAFVDEAVNSCFEYDEKSKTEVYDPTFLDFKMKSLFVKYYSNYIDAGRDKLNELYPDNLDIVEEKLYDIDTLYDFCCDIQMTEEYFESIGVDFAQYTRLAVAIEDRIGHRMRIIENQASAKVFINEIDEVFDTIGTLAKTFVDEFNNSEVVKKINEYKESMSLDNLVETYSKSFLAKKNQEEIAQARTKRKAERDKNSNIIPMSDYKDIVKNKGKSDGKNRK